MDSSCSLYPKPNHHGTQAARFVPPIHSLSSHLFVLEHLQKTSEYIIATLMSHLSAYAPYSEMIFADGRQYLSLNFSDFLVLHSLENSLGDRYSRSSCSQI